MPDAFSLAADELDETADVSGILKYYDDPAGFAREAITWKAGRSLAPYQAEILAEIPARKRVSARGCHGLGKCVHYSELVRMSDGSLVRAAELVGTCFEVLAVDPLTGEVRPSQAFAVDNGVKPVVRITTAKGRIIVRTLNHPLWGDIDPRGHSSRRGRVRPEGSWVAAGDLVPGSAVAVYLGNEGARVSGDESELTILGALLADGGLTAGSVGFSQAPGPLLEKFAESAAAFGCTLRHYGGVNYRVVKAHDRTRRPNPVVELCREWGIWGNGSRAKRMPAFVWSLDDKSLALLLNRMYACDGWAHGGARPGNRTNREIGYASACRGLAEDVQRALLRLGISAELRPRRSSWTYKGVKKTSEHFTVAVHDVEGIRAFAERVGILGKEDALRALLSTCDAASLKEQQRWQSHQIPAGFMWERVASVELLEPEPTVAITVPGPQTFLTDFIEHNTTTTALAVLWFALTRDAAARDWKCVTTAGAWRQLERYLWPEIRKWTRLIRWDFLGIPPMREGHELLVLSMKLRHGEAFAAASNRPELIEGAHGDSVMYVFDESKAIVADTFDAAEGAFSGASDDADLEAFALAMSTPGEPNGRFYDIHRRAPGLDDWHVRHVRLEEAIAAGRVSREWAQRRLLQWGADTAVYNNRVLGEFWSSDEDGVIPLSWIEAANERWRAWDDAGRPEQGGPHILGVDVARSGTDKTIIALRDAWVIRELRESAKQTTMATAGQVAGILGADPKATAVVDVIGIGAGVYDRLREQGRRAEAFNASAATRRKDSASGEFHFVNVRSASAWNLRELLDPSQGAEAALPDDDELTGDLTAAHWRVTSGAKIQVESKDDIRKRIGRSPDKGDAVIIAMWGSGMSWAEAYGMRECPGCEALYPEDSPACPECGQQAPERKPAPQPAAEDKAERGPATEPDVPKERNPWAEVYGRRGAR